MPWLGLVQEAVWRDRRVRVTYRRDDGQTFPRVLEPYGLVAKGAVWYCIAVAADGARVYGVANVQRARRTLQTYRVSRITAAILTDEPFTRPDDFDLPAWWQDWATGFEARLPRYEVTLRVPAACIPTLARLHGDGIHAQVAGRPATAPDARVTLTLVFDSPDAACGQILALGPGVEILAPPDLGDRVRDAAIRLAAYYADLDLASHA